MTTRTLSLCISALAASAPCALAGPDWVEGGTDAGSTLSTAQHTVGVGQILAISGSLGGTRTADFEDMFLIQVTNPVTFHLTTSGAGFDAQLFLFNITQANEAFGLLANDNTPSGNIPVLTPMATDGTFASINNPGSYAIAIAGAGRYPVSVSGAIFFFASPTEVSGPDGPGGINPHIGWAGTGATGNYDIGVTGVGFYETPAPGAGALLALAGSFAARRRRR
jgi:MYXO-CTERM domain-containing protein